MFELKKKTTKVERNRQKLDRRQIETINLIYQSIKIAAARNTVFNVYHDGTRDKNCVSLSASTLYSLENHNKCNIIVFAPDNDFLIDSLFEGCGSISGVTVIRLEVDLYKKGNELCAIFPHKPDETYDIKDLKRFIERTSRFVQDFRLYSR